MMADTDSQERVGVHAIASIVEKDLGWILRELPTSDYGIDALIEQRGSNGKGTGRLLALQIKSGISYFQQKGNAYVFHGEPRHLEYWTNFSLPVFIILHNPVSDVTLWQKIDQRLIEESERGWSIPIPKTNVLDASAKEYFEQGSAATPEAIRRFRIASDLENIRMFVEQEEIYIEVNDWVNKWINIREVGIYFGEMDKAKFDLKIPYWGGRYTIPEFMSEAFPWLDYDHIETEEALGGEVEVHTLQVWVNELGKAYIAVEDYFENGPRDPMEGSESEELRPEDE